MINYLIFKYRVGYIEKDEINNFFYTLCKLGIFPENEIDRGISYKKEKLFSKRILMFYIDKKYTINRPLLKEIIHYLKERDYEKGRT
jgi:hypothetical protein